MWFRKARRRKTTPTPMPISHHHTLYATGIKDRKGSNLWDLPKESFVIVPTPGNARICSVCLATYVHKQKCTNYQLPLEGSNRPHAK